VSVVGVGVDVVEVARIRTALTRTPGLVSRLFTEAERAACTTRSGALRYDRLAARFAAKEAVAKAFGTGIRGFGFRDVEVDNDELGRPFVRLANGAVAVAAQRRATVVHLSLSTSRELAVAQVVVEGE